MTPLRKKMIREIQLHRKAPKTRGIGPVPEVSQNLEFLGHLSADSADGDRTVPRDEFLKQLNVPENVSRIASAGKIRRIRLRQSQITVIG